MKILVVGGGGREHALVWKIAQSPRVEKVFAAPGNAGMENLAVCVPIAADDVAGLAAFARRQDIDLTVVGPETPLVAGLVDSFTAQGLRVFGPGADAARMEGSKAFAKAIMARAGVPTAAYREFVDVAAADAYVRELKGPCVIKADGLAAGKGVVVANRTVEARQALEDMMVKGAHGAAGRRVLVEELLVGEEVSVLAFTDGDTVRVMLPAQDHKQVFDGDQGPNTGGMGAYAPASICTPAMLQQVQDEILAPTVQALREEGIVYRGVLYAGLMITPKGPKVLEFNVRFGDPEAQPLLALLENDLVDVMDAVLDGRLREVELRWKAGAAVCVVLTASGYPGAYPKGDVIEGLEGAARETMVFHAGTRRRDSRMVTAGGRVLGVTALGADLTEAIDRAYRGVGGIKFEGMHFRRDIGHKGLR